MSQNVKLKTFTDIADFFGGYLRIWWKMKIEPENLCELEFELKTKNLTQFIKNTLKQAAPENSDKIDIFLKAV